MCALCGELTEILPQKVIGERSEIVYETVSPLWIANGPSR